MVALGGLGVVQRSMSPHQTLVGGLGRTTHALPGVLPERGRRRPQLRSCHGTRN